MQLITSKSKTKSEKDFNFEKFSLFNKLLDSFADNPNYNFFEFSKLIKNNISKIINFSLSENIKNTILYGEVQSGKTNNIIFLTSILFDRYFDADIIIFLGGTNNLLLDQNSSRFKTFNDIFKSEYVHVIDFNMKSNKHIWEYIDEQSKNNRTNENKVKLLFSVLKENLNLRKFKEQIELSYSNGISIDDKKIVIIDDECDNASINKQTKSNAVIQEIISKIKNISPKTFYFGISGTPYANLFIKNNQFPNRVIILDSSNDYKGLNTFHNDTKKFINILKSDKKDFLEIGTIWLQKTYLDFIYKIAKLNKDKNSSIDWLNYELMYNIDQKNSIHESIFNKLRKIIKDVYEQFIASLNQESNLLKKFEKILGWEVDMSTFNYMKKLNAFFHKNKGSMVILNSKNENKYKSEGLKIIMGGVLLGRGFTFNNLIVSVIFNSPIEQNSINADVMLQRARWFGYRDKNLNLISIFMNDQSFNFFNNINLLDKDLRLFFEKRGYSYSQNEIPKIKEIFNKYNIPIPKEG